MNFFGRVAAILATAAAVGLHNSSVLAGGGGGSLAGGSVTKMKVSAYEFVFLFIHAPLDDRFNSLCLVQLLHVERSLKGSDALGLKGDEAFANSAGVGPGGDVSIRSISWYLFIHLLAKRLIIYLF
jgi:hypothetical protein